MHRLLVSTILGLAFVSLGWCLGKVLSGEEAHHADDSQRVTTSVLGEVGTPSPGWAREALADWFGVEPDSEKWFAALAEVEADTRQRKFRELALWNPQRAAALAKHYHAATGDASALHTVMHVWADSDPGAVGSFLTDFPQALRTELASSVVGTLETENPWAMGALVSNAKAAEWPDRLQGQAARVWVTLDPGGAAAWITTLEDDAVERLASQTLSNFTIFSEVGGGSEIYLRAFGHLDVLENKDGPTLDSVLVSAQTPEEAHAFAETLASPSARAAYYFGYLSNRLAVDEGEALAFFEQEVPETLKGRVAKALGSRMTSLGDAGWEWMLERSNYFTSDVLANALFIQSFDPRGLEVARDRILDLVDGSPLEAAVSEQLSRAIHFASAVGVGHDTPGAVEWALGIEHPAARQEALRAVAERLTGNDAAVASQLIAEIDPGASRDALIEDLVAGIPEDPESAFHWASVVTDTPLREELTRQVLDQFWEASALILEETIHQSALSQEEKEALLADYVTP